jgi:hypothetical protein
MFLAAGLVSAAKTKFLICRHGVVREEASLVSDGRPELYETQKQHWEAFITEWLVPREDEAKLLLPPDVFYWQIE